MLMCVRSAPNRLFSRGEAWPDLTSAGSAAVVESCTWQVRTSFCRVLGKPPICGCTLLHITAHQAPVGLLCKSLAEYTLTLKVGLSPRLVLCQWVCCARVDVAMSLWRSVCT